METKYIVEIILVLIVAGVSVFVIFGPGGMIKGIGSDREMCRVSVVAKWASRHVAAEDLFDLECKSRIITIDKSMLSGASNQDEEIKRIIANEMYDCWYQFNRGQFDFENMFSTAWSGPKNVCAVCADIRFDSGVSSAHPVVDGFNSWIIDNKVPGKDYTYYDYLTNENAEDAKNEFKAATTDTIDTTKAYQVVFSIIEGNPNGGTLLRTFLNSGVIGVIRNVIKANELSSSVLMIPIENTPDYCRNFY